MARIEYPETGCQRCGYRWRPRVENPKMCPRCKQYLEKPDLWAKHEKKGKVR